jgi:hypothetical protein
MPFPPMHGNAGRSGDGASVPLTLAAGQTERPDAPWFRGRLSAVGPDG